MENSNNECPTEILINFKEDDFVPSRINFKEYQTSLSSQNPMKYFENKETGIFEKKKEKFQSIMDMSPLRLKKEFSDPVVITNSEQVLEGAVEDCPTAVLVEVPNSSSMCPKQNSILNCNKSSCYQEDTIVKCKSLVQDVKEQEYICLGKKKCSSNFSVSVHSPTEDSDNRYDFIAMKNELSPPRLRWKTPSPKSMSRISKEASKIIYNLNSSTLLEEDSLLCEEILPIPINFDYFDLDEDSDQKNLIPRTENSGADILSDHKSSVSIQTEEVIATEMISKEESNISSSLVIKNCINSPEYQNFFTQSSSEPFSSEMNLKDRGNSNECNSASEELKPPEVQCGSLDNSEIFLCNETTDVFIKSSIPSEDKENVLEREDKEILPSKTLNRCKATEKNSSVPKKEIKNRGTLRNLLNVKYTIESRNLLNANKIKVTQQNHKVNSKELLYCGKQQLKKTTSVEPQTTPKVISRSNSYQYDSKRKSISSFHKQDSVKKAPLLSEYITSSSDVKNVFMEMKTPSRRYSVATPLRNASTKKTALTSALPSFQNPSIPRFTPQAVGFNRLSFSKSWQQSNNGSNSKGLKYQNFMPAVSSAVIKPSLSVINSSKSDKKVFNQKSSMLSLQTSKNNSVSTSNKKRFCSRLSLSSSLHAEHDRKLARALFPSMPLK